MKKLKAFWYILKRSLLDPLYYKELLSTSFGFSYKYLWTLLTFLVVTSLIPLIGLYISNRPQIPETLRGIRSTLISLYPDELELRISNGKLYTNVDEPYIIPVPSKWGDLGKQNLAVIDTQATVEDYPDTDAFVLATRNAIVYPDRGSNNESMTTTTRVFYFREITRSVYVDKDTYNRIFIQLDPYIEKAPIIIDWVVFIGALTLPLLGGLVWSTGVLLGLLFNSFFIFIIARILKFRLTYGQTYRLGMHGITWSLLTQALLTLTKQDMPHAPSLVFFLWMSVVFMSLRQHKANITA